MILRYLSLAWFTRLGYGEFSWLRSTFVFMGCCVWLTRKCKKSSMTLKKKREKFLILQFFSLRSDGLILDVLPRGPLKLNFGRASERSDGFEFGCASQRSIEIEFGYASQRSIEIEF